MKCLFLGAGLKDLKNVSPGRVQPEVKLTDVPRGVNMRRVMEKP